MGKLLLEHVLSVASFIDEIGRASRRSHSQQYEKAIVSAVDSHDKRPIPHENIFPMFLGYGDHNLFRTTFPDVSRRATHVGDFRIALVMDQLQKPSYQSQILAAIGFEFQYLDSPRLVKNPTTICVVEGWKSASFSDQVNDHVSLERYQNILGWPWRAYLLSIIEVATHMLWENAELTSGLIVRTTSYEHAFEADRMRRIDLFTRRHQLPRAEQVTRNRTYTKLFSIDALYPSLLLYTK